MFTLEAVWFSSFLICQHWSTLSHENKTWEHFLSQNLAIAMVVFQTCSEGYSFDFISYYSPSFFCHCLLPYLIPPLTYLQNDLCYFSQTCSRHTQLDYFRSFPTKSLFSVLLKCGKLESEFPRRCGPILTSALLSWLSTSVRYPDLGKPTHAKDFPSWSKLRVTLWERGLKCRKDDSATCTVGSTPEIPHEFQQVSGMQGLWNKARTVKVCFPQPAGPRKPIRHSGSTVALITASQHAKFFTVVTPAASCKNAPCENESKNPFDSILWKIVQMVGSCMLFCPSKLICK